MKVADDGSTLTRLGRGALAVTCTTDDGVEVRALTAHLKSKLLSFPGGRFATTDEGERVRYWTMTAVTMPNRPASDSTWLRMWQCQTQVPGSESCMSTV